MALSSGMLDMLFELLHRPDTSACTGFEAVLQLTHPAKGTLPGEELAAAFDDPVLARLLSAANLRLALAAAADWQRERVEFGTLQFRLRGGELRDTAFVETALSELR